MDRRQFLHGSALAAGAVLLGACTDDSSGAKAAPGSPPTTAGPSSSSGAAPTDLTLAKTAASLEAMLLAAYGKLQTSGLVTNAALPTMASSFVQHHTQHLAALNGIITTTKNEAAVTDPNQVMQKQIVDPAFTAAMTEDDLIHLFFTLEDATAQTYVYAGGAATQPGLRSTFLTIGGIEARHRTILGRQFEQASIEDLFSGPFMPSDNPLPPDALLS
jgi:hypothetical protein